MYYVITVSVTEDFPTSHTYNATYSDAVYTADVSDLRHLCVLNCTPDPYPAADRQTQVLTLLCHSQRLASLDELLRKHAHSEA